MGERMFKEDFGRRVKMFNALVGSVALYGAEIWGWKKERLDRVEKMYLKWVLCLDRNTPNFILTEESKCEELSNMAVKRAL